MRNSECGIAGRGSNPTLGFRIPHSTFRISLRRLAPFPSPNDQFRRRLLLVPCLFPFDFAPGRGVRPPARRFPFAAAERVVDRVHRDPPHAGHAPEPAALARLAHRQELVLGVRALAHGGEALTAHHPHFGGAQPQRDVVPFLRHDLHAGSGRAGHLAAAPDLEPDVVYRGAQRDLEQRHRVAYPDVGARAGDDRVAHGESLGGEDVALLAVSVEQQRDACRAVRVVFDRRHLGRHAELLAPEVDAAILPLVAAAPIPRRDVALVVAAAGAAPRLDERLLRGRLRDLPEVRHRAEPRRRRHRLELSDAHVSPRTLGSRRPLSGSRSPFSTPAGGPRSGRSSSAWLAPPESAHPSRSPRTAPRWRRGSAAWWPAPAPGTRIPCGPGTPPKTSR